MSRIWPRSLKGQLLLTVALALLFAQGFSAILLYRAQTERRDAAVIHMAAFRLLSDGQEGRPPRGFGPGFGRHHGPAELIDGPRSLGLEHSKTSPLFPDETRDARAEAELARIFQEMDHAALAIHAVRREIGSDPVTLHRLEKQARILRISHTPRFRKVLIVAVKLPTGGWQITRVMIPPGEGSLILTLIGQTLLIYGVIVGAIALALRRITRPLAALTGRLATFADTRDAKGQIVPEGPDDVARLIEAHNAMETRIAALLDEKDVMLGAIGHDLKTPLAALRVRIESVENEGERLRMAATIEDIVRSLDDILSLARAGRPRGPLEPTELSALVASVVEEFEDMGAPVVLGAGSRLVLPARATLLRRALRNLIENALRYGKVARVSFENADGDAVIRVGDDGPGIPEADMARMLEAFTRGEPSRNSATGGAGLGLALARAIAEQHGGCLRLINRKDEQGRILGMDAELRLPLRIT